MSTATLTARPTPDTFPGHVRASIRRIASVARAEALLLRRNPMALMTALGGPLVFVLTSMANAAEPGADIAGGLDRAPLVVLTLAAFGLVFGVYYNLVTVLVARREQLVLKRFRTGELSDGEILSGTAAPAVVVAWGQLVVGAIAASVLLGTFAPTNVGLVLAGMGAGTVVFVLLAGLTAIRTTSVEMAQLTATPLLLVSILLSGAAVPLDSLPGPLQEACRFLPLTPVVELMSLGLSGVTPDGESVGFSGSFGPAVVPSLVLVAWVVVAGWSARRWFAWEPRR